MEELRNEIINLEVCLNAKKKELFIQRAIKILGNLNNVFNLQINVNPIDLTWCISYNHETHNYDTSDYAYNEDSADENNNVRFNSCKISFGKTKKYFIKGGIALNIYRISSGELRITNPDYDFDIDIEDQYNLMKTYSKNYNLPEWLAIKMILYISDNKWDDQSIINHFSVI
jgi:hypothetical protein